MKKAFIYKDEKCNKFWWIDYSFCDFVVNYGKENVSGKYELKKFDSEEKCTKQAEKLIASKTKKGYTETNDFDYINHFYFDDKEVGPHIKTSHPYFTKHFKDDLYYDCINIYTPFGSDEAADALHILSDSLRKKPTVNFVDFPRFIVEDMWDMRYIPVNNFDKYDKINTTQSDMITYAIAFGQIKITGKLDPILKKNAIDSIKRFYLSTKVLGRSGDSEKLKKMIEDLSSFSM